MMADVTGGTPPTNASPFGVPADIKAVYDHFGDATFFSVANAAGLPASGNWSGRLLTAVDTGVVYRWSGSSWGRVSPRMASGKATVAASGVTNISLPAGRFSVAPVIVATPQGNANVGVAHVSTVSTTSFELRLYTIGGGQIAGSVHWFAVEEVS